MKRICYCFLFVVSVVVLSCSDDDGSTFTPETITFAPQQGWPGEIFKIGFDNAPNQNFKIKFGTKEAVSYAVSDGLGIVVPELPADQAVTITMDTPQGVKTVKEGFRIRAFPTIGYTGPATFGFGVPLKIVVKNRDFYDQITAVTLCPRTATCIGANYSISGDTVIVKQPMSTHGAGYTVKIEGIFSHNLTDAKAAPAMLTTTQKLTYASSCRLLTKSGVAGGQFNLVLNDSDYYPDEVTVVLRNASGTEVTVENIAWDIIGDDGNFYNAKWGSFKVPAVPAGAYTVTVTNPKSEVYVQENGGVFTVTE